MPRPCPQVGTCLRFLGMNKTDCSAKASPQLFARADMGKAGTVWQLDMVSAGRSKVVSASVAKGNVLSVIATKADGAGAGGRAWRGLGVACVLAEERRASSWRVAASCRRPAQGADPTSERCSRRCRSHHLQPGVQARRRAQKLDPHLQRAWRGVGRSCELLPWCCRCRSQLPMQDAVWTLPSVEPAHAENRGDSWRRCCCSPADAGASLIASPLVSHARLQKTQVRFSFTTQLQNTEYTCTVETSNSYGPGLAALPSDAFAFKTPSV